MNSKVYVSMTDKFMSGWGRATGKTNKLVIECENLEEARTVYNNAISRHEMKFVNICAKKPYYPDHSYETSYHGKEDCTAWFTPQNWH